MKNAIHDFRRLRRAAVAVITGLILGGTSLPGSAASGSEAWTLGSGEAVDADFVRIQNDAAVFRTAKGDLKSVGLGELDQTSRDRAALLWNQRLSAAVKRIDDSVETVLREKGIAPNNPLTDEQFVRRAYLDIAGTIPTYEETRDFLGDQDPRKRFNLVSELIDSEGYVSHLYNYFAEQFRIQDYVPGTYLRTDSFSHWLKDGLRENRPYNEMVYDMVSADGRVWDNPASGFMLRDYDTPLDHVQYSAKVLLGTDISCAQCHDDPFQDWTQMDYYRLSAFLAEVETKDEFKRPMAKNAMEEIEQEIVKRHGIDMKATDAKEQLRRAMQRYQQPIRWMTDASKLTVKEAKGKKISLPDTYHYADGSPGDVIMPLVPFGDDPEFVKGKNSPREQYARWLTSPQNPRFAMNLANRMWERFFGRGVAVPLHNMDVEAAENPALLKVLEEEMIAVGFDLKTFVKILANTKTYGRISSPEKITDADEYYFPGPALRRMSAEQVWDSLITLMVENPLRFRKGDGSYYNETVNMLNREGPMTAEEYFERVAGYQEYSNGLTNYVDMRGEKGEQLVEGGIPVEPVVQERENMMRRPTSRGEVARLTHGDLLLARASEIEQPAGNGHFLNKFGQSERNFVVGASSRGGSVPQIMEMMNGFATEMITQPDSLIFRKMDAVKRDSGLKADIVFMSILNRKPNHYEREKFLKREIERNGDKGYANLIWALLNTPEFFFIK